MELKEIKEFKEFLPQSYLNCVNILEEQRKSKHFTAWSFGNSKYLVSSYSFDESFPHILTCKKPDSEDFPSELHPYFDLASLTKPFLINIFLRIKWKENYHKLINQKLSDFAWPSNPWNHELLDFIKEHPEVTLNTLLSHESYFDAWTWCKYFISVRKTDYIKEDFTRLLLKHYKKENTPVYSDLNYMFLALLIESLFEITNWEQIIDTINKQLKTNFFHASVSQHKTKLAVPSYPYCIYSIKEQIEESEEEKFFGYVHDTNANLFASLPAQDRIVSGHAGFYGNIKDVLHGAKFLQNTQPLEQSTSRFKSGLDYKNNLFEHLGYTGTGFWFNAKENTSNSTPCILLTNRTARRHTPSSDITPRLYVLTNLLENKTSFYMRKNDEESFHPLTKDDVMEMAHEYFSFSQKTWYDSDIIEYCNLTDIRAKIRSELLQDSN